MASKIKYEEVKESIEAKGWTLISDTYVNLKTDLELNCPNGHEVHTTYEDWRKGNCECAICN